MPFVERDGEGKIVGVYALKQEGYAEEELPEDSPEIAEFNIRKQET